MSLTLSLALLVLLFSCALVLEKYIDDGAPKRPLLDWVYDDVTKHPEIGTQHRFEKITLDNCETNAVSTTSMTPLQQSDNSYQLSTHDVDRLSTNVPFNSTFRLSSKR